MGKVNNHTGNSQNYNRYSYVLNNPSKYTDLYGNEVSMETAISASLAGFGGFNSFYNYLDAQEQIYKVTGGFYLPVNETPVNIHP